MISQWADVTSLHGVSEIKGSYKHQRKFTFLFWLTTLLVMLGLLAWQTYYLVTDFISGTGYSTTIYYEDVGSFSMPQVVICNYNRANKTSADAIQMNSSHLSYFFSGFMTNYLFNSNDTQLTELQLQFEDFVTKFPQYRDSNSLMNTLAHTCNETILTCLNGSTGWNDDCCNSKVTKTVHNLYGSCLSVNKSDVVQYTPGKRISISLETLNKLTKNMQLQYYCNFIYCSLPK